MLSRFLPTLVVAAFLASSANAEESAPAARPAPEANVSGAPPEAQLSPPEHAEKEEPELELTQVDNPAFPSLGKDVVPLQRGKRFEFSDVERYPDAPPEGGGPPADYQRASVLLRKAQWAEAAKAFEKLSMSYPLLKDRCWFFAGQAFEQLAQLESASKAYTSVEAGSRLFADARLSLARVLRRRKDLAGARAALTPLIDWSAVSFGRDVAAEALFLSAEISRQGAGKDAAKTEREALLQIWARHPLWKDMTKVEKQLTALHAEKSPDIRVTRAESLIESHRNKEGMEVLKPLLPTLKLPLPLACKAHFLYGKALRKERSHTQAIPVLAKVVDTCTEPDLRARALYVLGSSRSIVDGDRGVDTYLMLAKQFPQHSFADDALFYAADLYVKNKKPKEALAVLADLRKRYPGGDFQSEAYFKTYWILRTLGQGTDAISTLDQIRKEFRFAEEGYDYERATYWRAREFEDAKDPANALSLYEELASLHPATYYGLLADAKVKSLSPDAALRVAKTIKAPQVGAPSWPLYAGPLSSDSHFLAGVELLRLGQADGASAEFLAANRTLLPPESAKLLVQLLSMAQDARAAHALARTTLRKELSGPITASNRSVWEMAYPNTYRTLVDSHCQAASIEPEILLALMREESALDPRALSWAGALGLTQLMPSTARDVAARLKLPRPTANALFDPSLNIRLGSSYLGTLLSQFKGEKVYAVASYNAGPLAIHRWREQNKELPLDEWVEEIPLAETRGYVKRVLRSYRAYRLLYAPSAALQAARF